MPEYRGLQYQDFDKKGRAMISLDIIKEALNFPDDWEILSITTPIDRRGVAEFVISGNDFDEVVEMKEYRILISRDRVVSRIDVEAL